MRGVPGAQVVDDVRRGRVIERGQRFIEQQHDRVGDEGPRERGPLPFASGDRRRRARQHVRDPERFGDRAGAGAPLVARQVRQPILDVCRDSHMRETARDAETRSRSAAGRHGTCSADAELYSAPLADRDVPGVGPDQACDGPQQRALAGPRLAEHDRDAGRCGEGDVECERRRDPFPDRDGEGARHGVHMTHVAHITHVTHVTHRADQGRRCRAYTPRGRETRRRAAAAPSGSRPRTSNACTWS